MRNPTYKKHIFLIGFSGSGKSSVGRLLAQRLGAKFYDTDALIERQVGKTIACIFDNDGEIAFRRHESMVIDQLLQRSKPRIVVALGGGAFERRSNRESIKRHGLVVYLSCSIQEIYQRLKDNSDRPLLQVSLTRGETRSQALLRKIKALLARRKQTYEQADIRISTTNKNVDETVRHLCKEISSCDAGR